MQKLDFAAQYDESRHTNLSICVRWHRMTICAYRQKRLFLLKNQRNQRLLPKLC